MPPLPRTRRLLCTQDLAKLLGRTPDWFYRNRKNLIETEGFPQPVRGLGTSMWDVEAVEAWLDAQRPPALSATIKAEQIEAGAAFTGDPNDVRIFGLSLDQVWKLCRYYEDHAGKRPDQT